jgi:L-rhamnose isomerase/sugar isomerase
MDFKADYERLAERLSANGIDVNAGKQKLKAQHIETPSWGYGNSGTRFKVSIRFPRRPR